MNLSYTDSMSKDTKDRFFKYFCDEIDRLAANPGSYIILKLKCYEPSYKLVVESQNVADDWENSG